MRRRRSRTFGQALTTKDWLKYHPYEHFTGYDGYYLKLAKSVFDFLNDPKGGFRQVFQREHLQEMAVIVTCLFEDYVNEVGFWEAVKNKNKELYGWPIPFYDLSDYEPEYLNPEDYTYLIWHQLGRLSGKTIDPFSQPLLIVGDFCLDLFEDHVEEAPVTDFYQKWLDIPADIHFFDLKIRLTEIAFHTYLTGPSFSEAFRQKVEGLSEDEDSILNRMDPETIIYGMQDEYIYQKKSSWCAMSAPEWLLEVAQYPDSLQPDILRLSQRIQGVFLYEGLDENHYHYKFSGSGHTFAICKESIDIDVSRLKAGEDMAYFGIVNWKGEWWLSGAYVGAGNSPELKEQMQPSPQNANFYAWTEEQKQQIREMSAEMEEAFISFFGSRLVVFPNEKAMAEGMEAQNNWWNENKAKKRDPDRAKSRYEERLEKEGMGFDNIDLGGGAVAAYYTPGEGVLMSSAVPEIIQLMKKKQLTTLEEKELFYTFFSDFSPQLAHHLAEEYPTKNLRFPFEDDPEFTRRHFDFFLRYYNPEDFRETVPKVSLLQEE